MSSPLATSRSFGAHGARRSSAMPPAIRRAAVAASAARWNASAIGAVLISGTCPAAMKKVHWASIKMPMESEHQAENFIGTSAS